MCDQTKNPRYQYVNAPKDRLAWVDSEEGVIGGYWTDDMLTVQDAIQEDRRALIIDHQDDPPHVAVSAACATSGDVLSLAVWLREHEDRLHNLEDLYRAIGQECSDMTNDSDEKRR
jgi:hypothetical protein